MKQQLAYSLVKNRLRLTPVYKEVQLGNPVTTRTSRATLVSDHFSFSCQRVDPAARVTLAF